ncbi:MAG: radical SAM protein, partial [Bradyrhizobium sp.]
MIYPRFTADSFWNYQAACDLVGARYPAPPLGLITVAALLPKSWAVRLVNRNTEDLAGADLEWADLVMTGGMLFQQPDSLRIVEMCRTRGLPVVCGGPDVTSTPNIYRAADFRVLGEAESVMDDFVAAWRSGERHGTFEAPMGETDVTTSPVPRFDLLKFDQYLHIGIQFSRGCPFNCEFCDIIELYGRKPRSKTNQQILAELDALYALGYRGHVDFVDDNLIGNKKALKILLPELQRWMHERRYPFEFSTEASINLSDDPALLRGLAAANFFAVFVGIESPDTETLILTRKKQNTRRDLQESIHRIYDAGIFVFAGFILGFDTERQGTAEAIIRCIEDTAIPVCIVGLLYALPGTQLERRLLREGRMFPGGDEPCPPDMGEQCTAGLNFVTKRSRVQVLEDYRTVLASIYEPRAYFGRVRRMIGRLEGGPRQQPSLR